LHADKDILTTLRADDLLPHTRSSILCTQRSNMDFSTSLKQFNDQYLKPKHDSRVTDARRAHHSHPHDHSAKKIKPSGEYKEPTSSTVPHNKSKPSSSRVGVPIIIVPNSRTGVISSINIVDFLSNFTYIPIEQKLSEGAKRISGEILIKRDRSTLSSRVSLNSHSTQSLQPIEYKVFDDPRHLRDEDWSRVVAVFALGEEWQFKSWKWSKPAELFQHVLGVHVTLDDRSMEDKVGRTVLSWNCRVLKVNKTKRHLDAGCVNEFWGLLDDFVRLRKPHLMPVVDKNSSNYR